MRCDECRFWGDERRPYLPREAGDIGFKDCRAVRERWEIQDEAGDRLLEFVEDDETAEMWIEKRKDALRTARAYVEDGSNYAAVLLTGPDFFCALFQAKV